MDEIWQSIPGFEEFWVSNMGNVKSINGPLRPMMHRKGYLTVDYTKRGKRKGMMVHRLVALAFIPNPENKPQVNHKNGFKADNRADNLEWCTGSENALHSFRIGLQSNKGSRNPSSKATEEIAREIKYSGIKSNVFLSKKYGLAVSTIEKIKGGASWKHV